MRVTRASVWTTVAESAAGSVLGGGEDDFATAVSASQTIPASEWCGWAAAST